MEAKRYTQSQIESYLTPFVRQIDEQQEKSGRFLLFLQYEKVKKMLGISSFTIDPSFFDYLFLDNDSGEFLRVGSHSIKKAERVDTYNPTLEFWVQFGNDPYEVESFFKDAKEIYITVRNFGFEEQKITFELPLLKMYTEMPEAPKKIFDFLRSSIIVNFSGSSTPAIKSINYGSKIAEPTPPVKEGSTFEGWYEDPSYIKKYNFETSNVYKDMTLHAKWDDKTLYLYNWTYYTPEGVIEKFEKEFGVKVVLDYFSANEDMFAKLKAGGSGYDIVFPSQDYTSIMISEKMVIPLDMSKLPNTQYISPLAREKATYDPLMEYSVPYFMGAAGIAVNKTKVKEYPRDWSIFATKSLKNRMSMLDDMREVIGDALAYLGFSVNSITPTELKQAQDLINKDWKPNLVKFDAEGFAKSFASGEFYVVQGYAEAIFEELDENRWKDVDFFLPPKGGPMYLDSMVIPKGAKHIELAHEFINFIHQPEIYAEFLDRFHLPALIHTEAGKYKTTEPFYHMEDLINYELKNDLGEKLENYDDIWLSIRYIN